MSDIFNMPLTLARFSSWVSWLWVNHTSSHLLPEIPKQNTLAGLPVEGLLLIADFLPWEDVSCLSLCNRRLFAIFHRRNRSVQPPGREKVSFLIRLERDLLPTYFICHVCHLLHKYDASLDFTVLDPVRPLPCLPQWRNHCSSLEMKVYDRLAFAAHYNFYFFHLQLATRRFLYGPQFGISTEAMSYTCILSEPGVRPEKPLLLSIDAQMCCDPLGLVARIQRITYVPGHQRYLLYSHQHQFLFNSNQYLERTKRKYHLTHAGICGHVDAADLALLINPIVRAHRDGEKAPSSTYTCVRCDVNFRIEICEYETDLALVITRWIDLGTGSTPDDPRWELHSYEWSGPGCGQFRPAPNDDKTSARVRFENTSPRSLETLRSRNLYYLKDKRYEAIMDQCLDLWVLQRNTSCLRRWLA